MPRTQTCFVFAICVFLLMECVTPQRRGHDRGGGRRGGRRQGGGRGGRRQGGNQGNRFFGNVLTGGRPGQPFRPGGGGQAIGGIVSTALLAGGQILNQLVNQGGLGGRPQGGFGGRPQGGFGGGGFGGRPQGGFGGGGIGGRPQGGFGGGGFGGRPQGGFGGRPQGGFGGGGFGGRPQGGFGGGGFGGQQQGNFGSNSFGNSNFQNPIRPGTCPPVRPSCPPTRIVNRPEVCNSDIVCGLGQKCCFDTCLQYSTCKGVV